jgi:hypothetical protein
VECIRRVVRKRCWRSAVEKKKRERESRRLKVRRRGVWSEDEDELMAVDDRMNGRI